MADMYDESQIDGEMQFQKKHFPNIGDDAKSTLDFLVRRQKQKITELEKLIGLVNNNHDEIIKCKIQTIRIIISELEFF